MVQRTDRIGRVTTYGYDSLNQVNSENWYTDQNHLDTDPLNPLRTIAFSYDLAGQLLESSDLDHTYTWQYDDTGQVDYHTQDITGFVPTIEFTSTYDLIGQRIEIQADLGTTPTDPNAFINNYTYDYIGSMIRVTQDGVGGQASAVADKRIDFSYDLTGQLNVVNRFASLDTSDPIVDTEYSFDLASRLVQIEHTDSSVSGGEALLAGYDIDWDAGNRLTAIDFIPNGVNSPFDYSTEDVTFGYDPRDQLTSADRDGTSNDEAYVYDENGNRISVIATGAPPTGEYTVGQNNQILSDGTYSYTYDDEGNRSTRTNLTTGESTEYTWDHRNRLICIEEKNTSGTVIQRVEQSYDAFNQWIRRVVDPDGDTGGADLEQTVFVHENGQIVMQFADTGGSDLTENDLSHRYLWGQSVDQLLADEQVNGYSVAGEILWALTDHLGSVRDLVSYNDAASNTVLRKHMSYDAFGNVLAEQHYDISESPIAPSHAESVDMLFGYTGRPFDDETGLQNNLNRWYDSKIGKWMSEDPVGFADDKSNIARYVGNMPTFFLDPLGLGPREDFIKVTPGMPDNYVIHHTFQKMLKERYHKERGINIDEPKYCRGIHPDLHKEINDLQTKYRLKIREKYGPDWKNRAPLSEFDRLNKEIERTYNKLWMKAGATEDQIRIIVGRVDDALGDVIARGRRITGVMKKVGLALGVLSIIGYVNENVSFAKNMAYPDPDTQFAFDQFLDQYRMCLEEGLEKGHITQNRFGHFQDKLTRWMEAVGMPQDARNIISTRLTAIWAQLYD